MKRLVFGTLTITFLLLAVTMTARAQSADGNTMTDAHVDRIKANCTSATQALRRIHVNDASSRVDRRQVYDLVSSKLMARFNSRVALSKLDGTSLLLITSQYNDALTAFRSSDNTYDNQVVDALKIDCHKQPVAFYDSVAKARELRTVVYRHKTDIVRYAKEYQSAFNEFRQIQIDTAKVEKG